VFPVSKKDIPKVYTTVLHTTIHTSVHTTVHTSATTVSMWLQRRSRFLQWDSYQRVLMTKAFGTFSYTHCHSIQHALMFHRWKVQNSPKEMEKYRNHWISDFTTWSTRQDWHPSLSVNQVKHTFHTLKLCSQIHLSHSHAMNSTPLTLTCKSWSIQDKCTCDALQVSSSKPAEDGSTFSIRMVHRQKVARR
jgi:hypothetical protein